MGSFTTYYNLYVTDPADYVDPMVDWSENFVDIDNILHQKANDNTVVHLAGTETIAGPKTFGANVTLGDGINLITNTNIGSQIGTASNEKIGFYGATPIVRPSSTTDLRQALINLGFYATGGATPLDLNGGNFNTSGTVSSNVFQQVGNSALSGVIRLNNNTQIVARDNTNANDVIICYVGTDNQVHFGGNTTFDNDITLAEGKNIVVGTTTGTKFGTSVNQKIGFWNAAPVSRISGSTDVLDGLVTVGLRAPSSNPPLNLGTGVLTAGTSSLGATTITSLVSGSTTLGATTVTTLGIAGNITLSDGNNFIVGTSSGTQIGTGTTQKLGFFGATPVAQISGSTDVLAGMITLGFRAASSNPPLNLGTGALTAGIGTFGASASSTGQINLPNNTSIAWKGDSATPADESAITFDNTNTLIIGAANGITSVGRDTSSRVGFFGHAATSRPTITGSRGGNAALASLLTALASFGIVVDSSTV